MNVAQTLRALPTETEMKVRVCNQCLLTEDHPEFESRCPGTKTGKHRLRPRVLWAGVVLSATFDIRSEAAAIGYLDEGCWDANFYALARVITSAEIAQIRKGEKTLELRLVAIQKRKPVKR